MNLFAFFDSRPLGAGLEHDGQGVAVGVHIFPHHVSKQEYDVMVRVVVEVSFGEHIPQGGVVPVGQLVEHLTGVGCQAQARAGGEEMGGEEVGAAAGGGGDYVGVDLEEVFPVFPLLFSIHSLADVFAWLTGLGSTDCCGSGAHAGCALAGYWAYLAPYWHGWTLAQALADSEARARRKQTTGVVVDADRVCRHWQTSDARAWCLRAHGRFCASSARALR
ncbi:leucine-rich repeat (LRR) family protein [Striga asiatica]|uniref:Leucine-rich repeat (LRR) family protein n=1 Tax=Striga asiatica TaxID=4170 RepID=A0A5A7P7K5_STRAF|nr:leucine-rich repeat (LRR) family protein [Striga asiatica]